MADRNYAMQIATALAKADAQTLAEIGFELLASLGDARRDLALHEARKARDRERKPARNPRISRKSMSDAENAAPSPFSPTPPFNPTTSTASSPRETWRPDAEARLASRLPSNAGRIALAAVLVKCGDKVSVVAEIGMILDGGRPGTPHKPEFVELALCDYAANEPKWSSVAFRAYVLRASKPATQNGNGHRRGGVGQRSHDNAMEAIKDL